MANDYPEVPQGNLGDWFAQLFAQAPPNELQPQPPVPDRGKYAAPQAVAPAPPVSGGLEAFASVQDPRMFGNPSRYAGASSVASAIAQNAGMRALLGMPFAGGQLQGSVNVPALTVPKRMEPDFRLSWTRRF
jgi:hypothetical protein